MIRYLKENDVKQLLTMPLALELVEQALKDVALGRAIDIPRVRTHIPAGIQHVLQAAAPELGNASARSRARRGGRSACRQLRILNHREFFSEVTEKNQNQNNNAFRFWGKP